jgi:hypothetical protein
MPELTKQKISKELAMGRIAGPFSVPPPFPTLHVFLDLLNFACQVVAPGRAFSVGTL